MISHYAFNLLLGLAAATPLGLVTRQQPQAAAACAGNTPTTRSQWCNYNINTDWHDVVPNTGVTRTYYLEITNQTLAPDGVPRIVLGINGTSPGPLIQADWGDNLVIHVKNRLADNGTSIHWHGIRQNYTVSNDGVASITECPTAPGETKTYRWRATEYGSSWYHSHYSLQAWEGVYGPILINGPATSNYDVDSGVIALTDHSHRTRDSLYSYEQTVFPPVQENGLINGMNTYTANGKTTGSRFTTNFEAGKSYRLRLVNVAIDAHFKFSIDSHTLTVIAVDFVPIKPYNTTHINIGMGQRYDVVVQANQPKGNYWMRATIQTSCSQNSNPDGVRGIIRYQGGTADPTSTGYSLSNECRDEDAAKLVPQVAHTVGSDPNGSDELDVFIRNNSAGLGKWSLGPQSMLVEWAKPTTLQVYNGVTTFESNDTVRVLTEKNQWVYYVIETQMPVPHPIHLHGHDFYVLAQGTNATYSSSTALKLNNPVRRDTVMLPVSGFIVIAWKTDNPGAWLMHCHIGWHTAQGMAVQFVERPAEIKSIIQSDYQTQTDQCQKWSAFAKARGLYEEDSGI